MKNLIPMIILLLAACGLADSTYLSLMHFRVLGEPAVIAETCSIGSGSCQALAQSAQSTVLGVPIALFGVFYFGLVAAAAIARIQAGHWPSPRLVLLVIVVGFAVTIYLMHVLVFVTRVLCPFCMAAHAINLAIFVLCGWSLLLDSPPRRLAWH